MNKLVTDANLLDNRLLSTNEDEYERLALQTTETFRRANDLVNVSLDNFDPSYQTIPFLYILNAQIDASLSTGKTVGRHLPQSVLPEGVQWPNITRLLLQFDPIQVRYAGALFTRIIDIVAKGGEQTHNPVPAIQLIGNAILRLDPNSSTLTSTHYQYLRLCLLAQAYGEATAILELPLSSIPSADTTKQLERRAYKNLCSVHDSSSVYLTPATGLTQKLTAKVYLEYFLMGGMCYMALGQYQKALTFYEIVLVAPTVQNVASAVMVEAYKKWLLVNLLLHGTDAPPPKSMSPGALKLIRPLVKPYECLEDAFKSNRPDRLQAEIQEGIEIWQADSNYGLVHEVLMAFQKFSILRLGKIYAAVTIEEVAKKLSADGADVGVTLSYVQALITTGQLQAEIVPSTSGGIGTLRFSNQATNHMSEAEVEAQLAVRAQELKTLTKQIADYDHQMTISKDYIEWLQKLKAARDKEKQGVGSANRPVGLDMQDEDMMDDL